MDDREKEPAGKKSKRWILIPAGVTALAFLALLFTLRLPSRRIVILFTSEIRGHVVACGCYEGQPGGLGRLPEAVWEDFGSAATLLVDAGDFVGNPPMAGFDDPENRREMVPAKLDYLKRKHAALVEIFKTLDYDAIAPGENDFLLGQPFLLGVHHVELRGRVVNANIHYVTPQGTQPVFQPYRIVTVGAGSVAGIPFGGVRVGILGLIAPETPLSFRKEDAYHLTVVDPEVVARRMIPAMREKGADLILLLYHAPWLEVQSFLHRVDGIDVAVAGHDGKGRPPAKVRETHLVEIMPGCTQVGRVVLRVKGGTLKDVSFEAITLDVKFPEDPELLAPYRAFQRELAADPPVPTPFRTPPEPYAGSSRCADCHGASTGAGAAENPWDQWQSTQHARAYRTLVDRSHEGDPECLQCHTMGYGYKSGYGAPGAAGVGLAGVGCETCHGPRTSHAEKWEKRREAGEAMPVPKAFPTAFGTPCQNCHTQARDPGFASNKKKRFEAVRHRQKD